MIPRALIDLIFVVVLLAGYYAAYRAGWNDGRRWEIMHKQCNTYTGTPFPLAHPNKGDSDDLWK